MFDFFSLIFIRKLHEQFRNEEIFSISLLSKVQNWVLGVNFFLKFLVDIYPLDPDPWIRIFFRIRIQEAKILRIQRIRILSTALNLLSKNCKYKSYSVATYLKLQFYLFTLLINKVFLPKSRKSWFSCSSPNSGEIPLDNITRLLRSVKLRKLGRRDPWTFILVRSFLQHPGNIRT